MIRRFDSIGAFRQCCIDNDVETGKSSDGSYTKSWCGGETMQDALRMSETGNTELVPEAQALLSQLDTTIETQRRSWERSPAGAYACVPEAIIGFPTAMRRPIYHEDDRAPITVLCVTTSSAGIDAKTLMKRGVGILALVMALARARPVSLFAVSTLDGRYGDGDETVFCSRINTAPLDLATACYVLTSAGFDRRLNHGLAYKLNGYTGGWPRRYSGYRRENDPYAAYLAQALSPDPTNTLVINPAYLTDPLITAPVPWINAQIRRFTQQQAEETAP